MTQPAVELVIDCVTGETSQRVLPADEVVRRVEGLAQALLAQQQADDERQAALDRLHARAAADPDFAALARLAGVL